VSHSARRWSLREVSAKAQFASDELLCKPLLRLMRVDNWIAMNYSILSAWWRALMSSPHTRATRPMPGGSASCAGAAAPWAAVCAWDARSAQERCDCVARLCGLMHQSADSACCCVEAGCAGFAGLWIHTHLPRANRTVPQRSLNAQLPTQIGGG